MSNFRFETKADFLREARGHNPHLQGLDDESAYESITESFPEYKQQIAENYVDPNPDENITIESEADEKTFFTGLREIFSKDFYKLIPFVRDAELAETAGMLRSANSLKSGTASQEDVLKLKEWIADENRPTSWGYRTLMLMAHIPAYAAEFGLTSLFFSPAGGVARTGLATAARKGSKEGAEAIIKQITKRKAGEAAVQFGKDATEKAGKTAVAKGIKEGAEKVAGSAAVEKSRSGIRTATNWVGRNEFATRIGQAAKSAKAGTLKGSLKEAADKAGTTVGTEAAKGIGKTLGVGAGEVAIRNVFRSPQAVKNAMERMIPEMQLEDGIDGELMIEMLDDGDSILPALVKAYTDQGIEFFSESVGDSLYLMHHLFGGEVLRKGIVDSFKKGVSGAVGGKEFSERILNAPLKVALFKHMKKLKPTEELREKLVQYGFQGTIAEMYEERVGDVLRKATGLQDHWLPTPDQLASEALAFTLFAAGSSAANYAKQSEILGGAGIEAAKKAKNLFDIEPGEDAVKVQNSRTKEVDTILNEIAELHQEQESNTSDLVKRMRKVDIGGWKPFENLAKRGSVEEYLNHYEGLSLNAVIAAEIKKGNSKEEAVEAGRSFIQEVLENKGLYVVKSKARAGQVRKQILKGDMIFQNGAVAKGHYLIKADALKKGTAKQLENIHNEKGILTLDMDTFNSLEEDGLLEGMDISGIMSAKPGSDAAKENMDEFARIFHLDSAEEVEKQYELIHTILTSPAAEKYGITIGMMPGVVIQDKGSRIQEKGYQVEDQEAEYLWYIGASNKLDPDNPSAFRINLAPYSRATDTFEDLLEGIFKSMSVTGEHATSLQAISNAIDEAIPDTLDGYTGWERVSKAFMAGVLGIHRGRHAEEWKKVEFSESQMKNFTAFIEGIIGTNVVEMMNRRGQEEVQEETEKEEKPAPEPATAPEEAEEAPEPTNDTSEEEKPSESESEPSTAGIEALQEVAEEKLEPEAAIETIQDVVQDLDPSSESALMAMEAIDRLQAEVELENEGFPSRAISVAEAILKQAADSGISFSGETMPIHEGSSEEDILAQIGMAGYAEYVHDNSIESELSMTGLSRQITKLYGSQGQAIDYLYNVFKGDMEIRGTLTSLMSGDIDAFRAFLENAAPSPELHMLHTALKNLHRNPQRYRSYKEVRDILQNTFRRYENVFLMPVMQLSKKKKESKYRLQTLNIKMNEKDLRETIIKRAQFVSRDIQGVMLGLGMTTADRTAASKQHMAKQFANITGLGEELFMAFNPSVLAKYYNRFLTYLQAMDKSGGQYANARYISRFFDSAEYGNQQMSMLKELLIFNAGQLGHTSRFRNAEGNQESAFRQSSHMITARNAWAAEMGIDPERTFSMFSGSRNGLVRKGVKNLRGAERTKALLDIFNQDLVEIDGKKYYWQSIGQMGGKNHVYLFLAPYHGKESMPAAIEEYEKLYESVANKSFLISPEKVKKLAKRLGSAKGAERNKINFQLHSIINKARINSHLHGDYSQYNSVKDMNKRASQIPTGGQAWIGKNLNIVVVDDEIDGNEIFNGQVMFRDSVGQEFAEFMGPVYMRGQSTANSIKPSVSFIDKDGVRRQVKGAWTNISSLQQLDQYGKIRAWLDAHPEVDAIVPRSAAKVGYSTSGKFNTNGDLEMAEPVIEQINGRDFISVQNLNYGIQATLKNEAKQKNSDLIHGKHARMVSRIANENTEILLSMLGNNFDLMFSEEARELGQSLNDASGDVERLSRDSRQVLNMILETIRPDMSNFEAESLELTKDALITINEVIRDWNWSAEADASHFSNLFKAILNRHSELDPSISRALEAMKARFIQRTINRRFPRLMMQKVSAGTMEIPSFEVVNNHVRLPWIISNTEDVRTAAFFESRQEAIEAIQNHPELYADMFYPDADGNATSRIRQYEIRKYYGQWVVPGGIIMESRIPGENMQSHIPHRLWKRVGSTNANFSISPMDVVLAKGEDFDGDMGYQFIMHQLPKSQIEQNRNRMMMLQMDSFTDAEYYESVTAAANAQVFQEIADSQKDETPEDVYVNTVEGEEWANETNSTAFDALSRVAANIKFYDIAQALGMGMKHNNGRILFRHGKDNVQLKYNSADVLKISKTDAVSRKRYYATAMVNITVDDMTHQQMHKLGLNEITAPIAQALMALDTGLLTEADYQRRMESIVAFLKSVQMRSYIKARRYMESLEYDKKTEQYEENGEYINRIRKIAELMKADGITNESHINDVLLLDEMMQEINVLSQLIDTMYEAPKSGAEFFRREQALNELKENNFQTFDTSKMLEGDQLHPHLQMLETSLIEMKAKAFANNVLLSPTGRAIVSQLEDWQQENAEYLDHTERTIQRGLSIKAMGFMDQPNFEELTGYLYDELVTRLNAPEENWFVQMIQAGYTEQNRPVIQIHEAFQQEEIPEAMLQKARADFDKLPSELKQALSLYAVSVYGTSDSTWGGSFMQLIGRNYRRDMSQRFERMVLEFNEGKLESFNQEIQAVIKKDWWNRFNSIRTGKKMPTFGMHDVVDNENKLNYSPILLEESLMHADMTFLNYIDPAVYGELHDATEFNRIVEEARETARAEAIAYKIAPAPYTPSEEKLIGTDTSSYSLIEYHNAISKLSPQMMAGAPGIHKVLFKIMNETNADRIIGRLMREKWETSVGARKDFQNKLTEAERQRGRDVLSAITALITGEERVVTGSSVENLTVKEALDILWKMQWKRHTTKDLKSNASEANRKRVINAVQEGLASKPESGRNEDIYRALLEAELNVYARENDSETVPVNIPIFHGSTPKEIIDDYQANKEDWMADAEELRTEITAQFEKSRIKANQGYTADTAYIAKREGYVPLIFMRDAHKPAPEKHEFEGTGRSEKRSGEQNGYADAADKGHAPATTNIAELYELWTRDVAHNKYLASAWQIVLMGQLPDGSPVLVPEFNEAEMKDKAVIPADMIEAFANKLQFSVGAERQNGESAIEYINRVRPAQSEDFVRMETNLPSMPHVWVRKDKTRNLVKMLVGEKKEGRFWKIWESVSAWTKFMAIGFPYMSYFHWAALLESQVAIGGLKGSSVWNPSKQFKSFGEFRDKVIQDPYVAERWFKAGLEASLTNPDYAQGIVGEHLNLAAEYARQHKHAGTGKAIDKFIDLKENWDRRLWIRFHAPLKIWTAEGLFQEAKQKALEEGRAFNEEKMAEQISEVVDHLYGGINFQRRIWATPVAVQMAHDFSFAFDWTYAALGIAGAGNVPGLQSVFGKPTDYQNYLRYGKYWPAFIGIVMFAIPNALQSSIWALTRPIGGDDDDQPFTFLNEHDRASWVDVTPLVRMFDPRDKEGERRVYLRWGKQGYEIKDWLTHAPRTAGHKANIPLKWAYEQITGRSVGGWDMAFKNASFFGVMQAQGSFWKGRAGDTAMRFIPFTVQDLIKGRPTAWFAKAKAGKHGWYASKQLTEIYLGYVNKLNWDKTRNHEKNIIILGSDLLQAAAKNEFDANKVQRDALQNARAELYMEMESALRNGKTKLAEGIAERLMALESVAWKIKKIYMDNPVVSG